MLEGVIRRGPEAGRERTGTEDVSWPPDSPTLFAPLAFLKSKELNV